LYEFRFSLRLQNLQKDKYTYGNQNIKWFLMVDEEGRVCITFTDSCSVACPPPEGLLASGEPASLWLVYPPVVWRTCRRYSGGMEGMTHLVLFASPFF